MKPIFRFLTLILLLTTPHLISSSVSAKPNWEVLQKDKLKRESQIEFAAYRAAGGAASYVAYAKEAEKQWAAMGMAKPTQKQSISLLKQSVEELLTGERTLVKTPTALTLQLNYKLANPDAAESSFVYPHTLNESERGKRMMAVNFALVGGSNRLAENFQELDPQEASSWAQLKLAKPEADKDIQDLFKQQLDELITGKRHPVKTRAIDRLAIQYAMALVEALGSIPPSEIQEINMEHSVIPGIIKLKTGPDGEKTPEADSKRPKDTKNQRN